MKNITSLSFIGINGSWRPGLSEGKVLLNPFLLRRELREYEMRSAAVRRLIGVHRSTPSALWWEKQILCVDTR